MRASCSVVGRTPMTGMWKTQNTLEPSELTQSATRLLSPLMTDEMVITVVTPMTMPRMVEPGAQLVGAQRVQRHFDRFACLTLCHEQLSSLANCYCSTFPLSAHHTGSSLAALLAG